jgi:tetratricopeptide (TPR) repeat protein
MTGQTSKALRLTRGGEPKLQTHIRLLERQAAASGPDVKCPDGPRGDLCRSLRLLVVWLKFAEFDDGFIKTMTTVALKTKKNRRSAKPSPLLRAMGDHDGVRRVLGLPAPLAETRWQKIRVSPEAAEKLTRLSQRAERASSEKLLEFLWGDKFIRRTLLGSGMPGDSITDALDPKASFWAEPVAVANADPDADAEASVTVSLQNVITTRNRRYVVIRAAVGGLMRQERWNLFELPTAGATEAWYWAASTVGGKLQAVRLGRTDAVLISSRQGSGGFLDAWLALPTERKTMKVADDIYQGDVEIADLDGRGQNDVIVSQKIWDRDRCNACPGKREATVMRFQDDKLTPVARFVSTRDGEDIDGEYIKRRMAALYDPPPRTALDQAAAGLEAGMIFDQDHVREAVAVILLAIDKSVQAGNFSDAIRYAEKLVSTASILPPFDERNDWLAAAAGLGADAARAVGEAARASALTDAFPAVDQRVRDNAIRSARFRAAQAKRDTEEQCNILQEVRDQNPAPSAASPMLTQYFRSVGDHMRALESARVTVQEKWLKGEDATEAFFAEAIALTELGNLESALAALTLIVRSDDRQLPRALLTAAAIAVRAGELKLGRYLMDSSLELKRDGTWSSSQGASALFLYRDILQRAGHQDTADKLTRAALGQAASTAARSAQPLRCH